MLGYIVPTEDLIKKFGYGLYAPETPHPSPDTMRYPVVLPGFPTRNLPVNEGHWDVCGQCHRLDAPLGRPEQAPPDIFKQLAASTVQSEPGIAFQQLTQLPGRENFPLWSPDAEHILYSADTGDGRWNLWVMTADGSQQRQLTDHPSAGWANWHSDGQSIVYWASDEQGRGNVWTIQLDGSGAMQLTDETMTHSPEWSPNGRFIAYMALRDKNWDVWMMNADGSNPRRLTTDPDLDGMPHWSPDGRKLTFKAMRSGRSEFYTLSFLSRNGVVDYAAAPTIKPVGTVLDAEAGMWSADGKRVAFVMYALEWLPDGRVMLSYKVWASAANGDNPRMLTPSGTLADRSPRWSPDGAWIAFWSWDPTYHASVWIVSPDGAERYELSRSLQADALYPSWSPDGERIAFASNQAGEFDIWVVDLPAYFGQR